MDVIKVIFLVIFGFGSGLVISGGIFAFIATIGIVPRLAQKTRTEKHIKLYEDIIIVGGIFGATTMFVNYYLPIGIIPVIIISLCIGIFVGCLAVSLVEILNVVPILTRRINIKKGMPYFITSIALGKLTGSLIYYFIPGFFKP